MNKKQAENFTDTMLIADALLRLTTLESLLIAKGIFSKEEFVQEMEAISSKIAKTILKKANVPGDLDELIKSLQGDKKKDSGN